MRQPGAPGTALPNQVRWALEAASCGHRGYGARSRGPRERVKYGPYVVTLTRTHLPYGASNRHGARYAHLVRYVWIAWREGRPVAARARWWCGATCDSHMYRLTDEPSREVCPMCQFTITRNTVETAGSAS